jgi:hypothetical protein
MDRETVEEIKGHFGIVAGGLEDKIRAVAEGQQILAHELRDFRADVAREFEETRGMIRLSYAELDRRLRDVERDSSDLRARIERIEERLAS